MISTLCGTNLQNIVRRKYNVMDNWKTTKQWQKINGKRRIKYHEITHNIPRTLLKCYPNLNPGQMAAWAELGWSSIKWSFAGSRRPMLSALYRGGPKCARCRRVISPRWCNWKSSNCLKPSGHHTSFSCRKWTARLDSVLITEDTTASSGMILIAFLSW